MWILPFFIGLAATTLMRNPPWGWRRTDLKRKFGTSGFAEIHLSFRIKHFLHLAILGKQEWLSIAVSGNMRWISPNPPGSR